MVKLLRLLRKFELEILRAAVRLRVQVWTRGPESGSSTQGTKSAISKAGNRDMSVDTRDKLL